MDQQGAADRIRLAGLLQAIARGDRPAFRALYEATAPKLFGVVLRIVGNRQVAEEVLQETFVRVWQKAERFEPNTAPPISWLATIARNRAIDRIRADRNERNRTGDDEAVLERLAAPGEADPVLRDSLRRCLGALDEDARACVVLAYCSGYSREELGQKFKRPEGTIKTLLHRSLKVLKACLESE